ncbi:MAG: pyruvate:ferredoxin (flavodoxin) oxidoreductase [Limisphaerales bacterium]|jgi:pyruvate-ferredoxin/flavodoxin oxidoreductase|nr:pyruvate:ferredoxin (flavodoxin) oxidoreductase [Verrucomicrobiota bacterium]
MAKKYVAMDGNEAVAYVAYRCNEVCGIYPITPSSNMAEWCDEWAARGVKNLWGSVPSVMEMQSEGGAAGTVHGSLLTGSLTTTFTASQGLLLKIPNMYKIAGELLPTVFHISARALATHALSIFGDHSDVMSARNTGFAMLASASVQEAMDMALISQAATLESRIPFMHFFDGFRTSHEVSKIELLSDEVMKEMIQDEFIVAHRQRALNPDNPTIRGTAQNPDVFFQCRERCNPFYDACPAIVQKTMDKFAKLTGRQYKLFEYTGAEDAENVLILMGSGCEVAHETLDALNGNGAKLGLLKVRLYRPFSVRDFVEALPSTTKKIAVLDRTKEPGATGEPLYQDVLCGIAEALANGCEHLTHGMPMIVGGRYGLASKDFTPAMVKAVYDNLEQPKPKNHFTVGIVDDVTHTSLPVDKNFSTEPDSVIRAMFYGLGSDGTVGANKNTIRIIGEEQYAQGYFVYDSKKSGSITVSHVRFGPNPIRSSYLISRANFVACHQPTFPDRYDMSAPLIEGGTLLINTPFGPDKAWDTLPAVTQKSLIEKKAKLYVIDANKVANDTGMGSRINTIMQVCFFALSGVLPKDIAIEKIKGSIKKTYGSKGDDVVAKNIAAVNKTLECLFEVAIPTTVGDRQLLPPVASDATEFVKLVLGPIIGGFGDDMPVSAFTPVQDGAFPTDTARYEKRDLALEIPVWDVDSCIQCLKCVAICPHAVIRGKFYDPAELAKAPPTFKSTDSRVPEFKGQKFSLQVSVHDCTGCGLCVETCPAKSKTIEGGKAINMAPQVPLRESEGLNWEFFLSLPDTDRTKIKTTVLRQMQVMRPLFEFSGACPGCGETPYIKMLTQLFGDRLLVANATGCSSIYGANLPTTPYAKNAQGRGPAWANSLFEDNAEFGLGFRLALDKQNEFAHELLVKQSSALGDDLITGIIQASQNDEAEIAAQRERVGELKKKLLTLDTPEAKMLLSLADSLVKRSVWILGGDGWAYDIGYGGLDHVLASGKNVNVLVLDTEVYSNTGGQSSKATPKGAVAKFSASGKTQAKKDMGLIAMSYGHVYVASVAMGANDNQTLRAMTEAEAYNGSSLIIAYSHCINHGYNMAMGGKHQKALVDSGLHLLYRYNPERVASGLNPLQLDSKPKPSAESVLDFFNSENRFRMLMKSNPETAKQLALEAANDATERYQKYQHMASQAFSAEAKE